MLFRAKLFAVIVLCGLSTYQKYAHAESKYLRNDDSNRQVIVFVHGVMGNSLDTWTNNETKAYWPSLIAQDQAFSNSNIFVLDFASPKIGVSFSVDELADNMRLILESNGVSLQTEIIFVAHSMGGLVTRAYLAKYRDVAKKVKFIYFLATPTTGAAIASIARLASFNPQFAKMVPMTSDSYLADLQRTWLASSELSSLPSYCAYELQFVAGLKIVEQQSATNLCNRRLDPMNYNHIDIVKPANAKADQYLAFKSAYIATKSSSLTGLRSEIQNVTQLRQPIGPALKTDGQRVFCDSVRLTLLFAHSKQSDIPLRISSVSPHVESIADASLNRTGCAIDPLSSRPYGIVESETYVLTSFDDGVKAKYIKNMNSAFAVRSDNILRSEAGTKAITLKPGEEPVAFDVLVEAKAAFPQRIWFSIEYDEDGPRVLTTRPIILWR